jgi:hypothetical protein
MDSATSRPMTRKDKGKKEKRKGISMDSATSRRMTSKDKDITYGLATWRKYGFLEKH